MTIYPIAKTKTNTVWILGTNEKWINSLKLSAWKLGKKNKIPRLTLAITVCSCVVAYSKSAYPLCATIYTASVPKVAIPPDKKIEKNKIITKSDSHLRKIPKIAKPKISVTGTSKKIINPIKIVDKINTRINKIAANPKNFPKIIFPRLIGLKSVR